jgi:soluble lytic murein transglycosylase-like protein
MTRAETIAAIKKAATAEGIDPEVYLAICTVESSLNPFALRYEPAYRYTTRCADWASNFHITPTTEEALQRFSYGASQIMGGVLREYGYGKHLALWIADLEAPIIYGAKHLKKFMIRYPTLEEAVASYNAGSPRRTPGMMFENQVYVDKVFRELRALQKLS